MELIEKLMPKNEELRKCYKEHQRFERMLDEMNERFYLTPQETLEQKKVKKLKLANKDQIEKILSKHR